MWYLVRDWTTNLILVHHQCQAGYSCGVFGYAPCATLEEPNMWGRQRFLISPTNSKSSVIVIWWQGVGGSN